MKKFIFLYTVIFLSVVLFGFDFWRPRIFAPIFEYDFGTVWRGETLFYDFIVQNKGNAPLIIDEVKTG